MFTKNQQNEDFSKQLLSNVEVDMVTSEKNDSETKKTNTSVFSFTVNENVNNDVDLVEFERKQARTMPVLLLNSRQIDEHDCGELNNKCQFCGAFFFKKEVNNSGLYKSCCYFGKVKHQEREVYPETLHLLLTESTTEAKKFRSNIRSYNSALAFASMGAKIETIVNGPYCFKVHGQVYHNTYNVSSSNNTEKKYSQLYVVDTEEACEIRMKKQANSGCDPAILRGLDSDFRRMNPYSDAFKNMGEVITEKKQQGLFIDNVSMFFNKDISRNAKRYNSPTSSEIAMVFTDPNGEPPFERDIKVYSKNTSHDSVKLSLLSPHLDPMTYVLFYPHGESGWQANLRLMSYLGQEHKVSMLQYKVTQLAIRPNVFNPLLCGGKLLQQWIVDSYLQVEANNLNFIRLNQRQLRIAQYKGLVDYVNNQGDDKSMPVILPSSFQGSPRNMRERYHDAMAIVTKFGKPDLFITFTCNPNWKEIRNNLFPGQTSSDRPDLVARVFNIKLKALIGDIVSGKVAGEVVAHVHSIEFQKRGLPHAHILVILKNKVNSLEKIDDLVSAEIPNPEIDGDLYAKVMKHMIHGPCGLENPNSPCMENGICSKDYPKDYIEKTLIHKDGYPLYKRSKGPSYKVKTHDITNINVIPYNRFLLAKYNSHINVEVCTSIKSVKYIFKYIYKGYDCAEMRITDNNEIDNFINSRYVSAPEAMWRLLENKMHGRSHTVIRLPVHLEQQQMICFEEGKELEAVRNEVAQQTQLLAWFRLNQEHPEARSLYYSDIPHHYTYAKGVWTKKKNVTAKIITRLYAVSPVDKERFNLRILLLNVKGAKSFDELKSYRGTTYQSFEEAVDARGLLSNDNEWERVLDEAVSTESPSNIRSLFAYICAFNQPKSCLQLFDKYYEDMADDFKNDESPKDKVLSIIKEIICSHGWSMERLGLPEPTVSVEFEDMIVEPELDIEDRMRCLNENQQRAYDRIINSVDKGGKIFYLDGPAGSGKTYLYNVLIDSLKNQGKLTIQMATTGIAADLLNDGRTVHSFMKLPVPLNETSSSRLQINSSEAQMIRRSSLILIDEVSMMSKYALDVIDTTLKRICFNDDIFGGKTILLGGDFKQAATVVLKGNQVSIIENSIISSRAWRHVEILRLSYNMRSANQPEFAKWLSDVGNGFLNDNNGEIVIPSRFIVKGSLISSIFGKNIDKKDESVFSKVILTTKNEYANVINAEVLSMLDGDEFIYKNADSIVSDDPNELLRFPTEFLNKQQPSGLPQHTLKLKVGCLIMLLRNVDPRRGLLNGTRLQILRLRDNYIVAKIITGRKAGYVAAIPRIDMQPSDTLLPFVLKRRQFPVIVSYAMTIHKSQGQSFDNVGVYLPEPVFAHGQLYVAISRIKNPENLKIFLSEESENRTKNIVYQELLQGNKRRQYNNKR